MPVNITDLTLRFGEHRGKRLGDVPDHYLVWVLWEFKNLNPMMRACIHDELVARLAKLRREVAAKNIRINTLRKQSEVPSGCRI